MAARFKFKTSLPKASWRAYNIALEQEKKFQEIRKHWVRQVKADPTLGGKNFKRAMQACRSVWERFAETAGEEGKRADDFLRLTGAGDHPTFLRLLYRVAYYFDPTLPKPKRVKRTYRKKQRRSNQWRRTAITKRKHGATSSSRRKSSASRR
jgi:hypothetical protein